MTNIIPRSSSPQEKKTAYRGGEFTLNKNSNQAKGLIGWWPLGVHGGITDQDYSDFKIHGTRTSGIGQLASNHPRWGATKASDHPPEGDIPEYILLNPTNRFDVQIGGSCALTAWVKTTDTAGPIFTLRNDSNGNPIFGMYMGLNGLTTADGELLPLMRFDNGGGLVDVDTETTINNGAWRFVACVFENNANLLRAIIDNTEFSAAQTDDVEMTFVNSLAIGTDKRWIDNVEQTVAQRKFVGQIKDCRAYNFAPTPNQIQQIRNNPWQLVKTRSTKLYSLPSAALP